MTKVEDWKVETLPGKTFDFILTNEIERGLNLDEIPPLPCLSSAENLSEVRRVGYIISRWEVESKKRRVELKMRRGLHYIEVGSGIKKEVRVTLYRGRKWNQR